jgi:hypothetical protein
MSPACADLFEIFFKVSHCGLEFGISVIYGLDWIHISP